MSSAKTTYKGKIKPKVSAIVPVWNPGPGISRCIETLRKQTLEDIEMIFIDDCGTDGSMDKVREAAQEDSRIRIIENEENIGAGASRNKGIEVARGEYLSFVDADDYIATDFLELLYSEARRLSLDIVKGTRISQKENGEIVDPDVKRNLIIQEGLACGKPLYLLFGNEHQTAVYRCETVLNKKVGYGTSKRGEDTLFLLRICSQTDSFGLENAAHYYYCERPDGAINSINALQLQGHLQSIGDRIEYVLNNLNTDVWSKEYLKNKFLFSIKEGWRYRKSSEGKDYLLGYKKNLRDLFMRLPYHKELAENSYSLYALEEYEEILPIWTRSNDWEKNGSPREHIDLTGLWVEHLLKHKNYAKNCVKELGRIVVSARRVIMIDSEEPEREKKELESLIKQLPPALRFKVLSFSAKYGVKAGMSRVLPRRIKVLIKNYTSGNRKKDK